jgi:lipopolysaccharide transport system ATP-binding protein
MQKVIKFENISKVYMLHHERRERYTVLRDVLANKIKRMARRFTAPFASRSHSHSQSSREEFFALKDVSFEIEQGDRIGIIGPNGAGKSTLLKIISRITEPSKGKVSIKGRLATLLEVGTGFHPELTGSENIYLNGAILGMTRREIKKKFDEIVAFAEVERFLDTPVKRYSSGMYVRLAFAVAAHLEPEILIVDEVLAVGDAQFQKKCIGKMEDVGREGRTVLFVSHNMGSIVQLCTKGMLINSGKLVQTGAIRDVVNGYMENHKSSASVDLSLLRHTGHQSFARLLHLHLCDSLGRESTSFVMGEAVIVHLVLQCTREIKRSEVGLKISSMMEQAIHYYNSAWEGMSLDILPGIYTFEIVIPKLFVFPGKYIVGAWVSRDGEWSDDNVGAITMIDVVSSDVTGNLEKNNILNNFNKYANSGCEVYAPSIWKLINTSAMPLPNKTEV